MMVPRDMTKCAVRQAKYVFVTATDGGIINDGPAAARGGQVLALAHRQRRGLVGAEPGRDSGMDVTIREVDVAPVQIQGPRSKEVMVELFGSSILDIPYYFMSQDLELDGMRVVISRTGYTSELGVRDLPARCHGQRTEAVGEQPATTLPRGPCLPRRVARVHKGLRPAPGSCRSGPDVSRSWRLQSLETRVTPA